MNLLINAVQKYGNVQQVQKPVTAPVIQYQQKPDSFEKTKDVTASIFYIADIHGKMTNMERVLIKDKSSHKEKRK